MMDTVFKLILGLIIVGLVIGIVVQQKEFSERPTQEEIFKVGAMYAADDLVKRIVAGKTQIPLPDVAQACWERYQEESKDEFSSDYTR